MKSFTEIDDMTTRQKPDWPIITHDISEYLKWRNAVIKNLVYFWMGFAAAMLIVAIVAHVSPVEGSLPAP